MRYLKRLAVVVALGVIAAAARLGAADAPVVIKDAGVAKSASPVSGPAGWKLVWNDEFEGKEIDRARWDFDRGNFLPGTDGQGQPGWGNNELEFYTPRPENAFLSDGMLHLKAIKESYKGCQYTSAKMKTKGLFARTYGRYEFRAKLPTGKGVWPAIWMLPQKDQYGAWAASGEIDILEARGQEPNKVLGTLHYGSKWPANTHTGKDYLLPDKGAEKGTFADFHVYALEWEPGEIRWYVDDQLYQTQSFWWSCSDTDGPKGVPPVKESELNPWPAPFNQPYYIILNLAVGGNFLGPPDAKTAFPVEMLVDYVRVFEKTGEAGPAKPRGPGKLPFEK